MKQPVTDFSYAISKEENQDVREATIVKTGLKAEFNLNAVYVDYDGLAKKLREQESQVKLTGAEVKNIEENHPFILTLSEQDIFTAALYYNKKRALTIAEKAVAELTEAIAEYDQEIQKIHSDLNLPTRHEMETADKEKAAALAALEAEEAAKQPAEPIAETPIAEPVPEPTQA